MNRDIPPPGGGAGAEAADTGAQRGRPRSAEADRAILTATVELLADRGLAAMSIEEVAARAGVGKTTIYRRWPSKGLLALDAFVASFREEQPLPDTGTLRGDLVAALRAWVRAVTQTPMGPMLTGLIAAAQYDQELRGAWRDRVLEPLRTQHRIMLDRAIGRGEIPPSVDRDVILDLFFGAAEHRLLLGHLPMTGTFIDQVVDVILAGISPAGSPRPPGPPGSPGSSGVSGVARPDITLYLVTTGIWAEGRAENTEGDQRWLDLSGRPEAGGPGWSSGCAAGSAPTRAARPGPRCRISAPATPAARPRRRSRTCARARPAARPRRPCRICATATWWARPATPLVTPSGICGTVTPGARRRPRSATCGTARGSAASHGATDLAAKVREAVGVLRGLRGTVAAVRRLR